MISPFGGSTRCAPEQEPAGAVDVVPRALALDELLELGGLVHHLDHVELEAVVELPAMPIGRVLHDVGVPFGARRIVAVVDQERTAAGDEGPADETPER